MTLIELQAKARRDLTARPIGVLLEWSLLVADFTGRLRDGVERLGHLEHRQRDYFDRMLGSFPPSQEALDRFQSLVVSDAMIAEARREVAEAETLRSAAELVLRLLERPRKKPEAPVIPLHPVKPKEGDTNVREENDRRDGARGAIPARREAEAQGPARRG